LSLLRNVDARHLHGQIDDMPELEAAARARGMTVSVDAFDGASWASPRPSIELLRDADVLLRERGGGVCDGGNARSDAALELLAAHCGCVVIRRGADGAVGIAGGEVAAVPADPVDVVDTTGAGDCFNAGFLAGWLSGLPIEHSLDARRDLRERFGHRFRWLPRLSARRGVPRDRGVARDRRAGDLAAGGGARMKMTLLGAGVRAPFVLRGLAAGAADLDLDEVVLFDTDPERLELMTALGAHFAASWGAPFTVGANPTPSPRSRGAGSCSRRSVPARRAHARSTRRCRSSTACSVRRRPVRAGSRWRFGRSPRWSATGG
jgi:hypothetical protein